MCTDLPLLAGQTSGGRRGGRAAWADGADRHAAVPVCWASAACPCSCVRYPCGCVSFFLCISVPGNRPCVFLYLSVSVAGCLDFLEGETGARRTACLRGGLRSQGCAGPDHCFNRCGSLSGLREHASPAPWVSDALTRVSRRLWGVSRPWVSGFWRLPRPSLMALHCWNSVSTLTSPPTLSPPCFPPKKPRWLHWTHLDNAENLPISKPRASAHQPGPPAGKAAHSRWQGAGRGHLWGSYLPTSRVHGKLRCHWV